jgi:transcriptional regulator
MSIRRKVLAVLTSLHRRVERAEDDAERNAATLHRMEQAVARIETAVVEQGKTLGTVLTRLSQDSSRSGVELKRHEETLFNHEGRLGTLERAGANGAE